MAIDADAIRGQVDRLVHSKAFETSEVHRHLLRYLAEKSISGEADRLKEYTLGLEAFGKPPTYDPKTDSIARLQVSRLRQKLSAYYQNEAADDPILITLPKGAFRLAFEPLTVTTPREIPAEQSAPSPAPWRWKTWALVGALMLAILWAAVASFQLSRLRRDTAGVAGQWSSDIETIWAPFLKSTRPFVLCLGTPLFVRLPGLGFFRDPRANDWPEAQLSERVNAVRKPIGDQAVFPMYAFTGAGEASAAILIAKLLSSREPNITLTRSNILSWQQLVDDDVLFIGPPKFNPQLETAASSYDFVVEPDGIRNRKPRAGEPAFLKDQIVPGKQSEGETHALISLTPGVSGIGDLMVLGGNASADTFAAAEWLSQPRRAAELLKNLRDSSGKVPRFYQVVLKVSFKQGIPVQSSYVFHHEVSPASGQNVRK